MGGLKNKEMISEREGSAAGLALSFQAHATLWDLTFNNISRTFYTMVSLAEKAKWVEKR